MFIFDKIKRFMEVIMCTQILFGKLLKFHNKQTLQSALCNKFPRQTEETDRRQRAFACLSFFGLVLLCVVYLFFYFNKTH